MDFRKLLKAIGKSSNDVVPAVGRQVDDVAEELLPAIRKPTIPVEVGPEVIGRPTPKVAPIVDIPDAELVNRKAISYIEPDSVPHVSKKVSNLDAVKQWIKENPKKAAAMGSAGIAGIAQQFINDDSEDVQIPMAPQSKKIDNVVEVPEPTIVQTPEVAAPEVAAPEVAPINPPVSPVIKPTHNKEISSPVEPVIPVEPPVKEISDTDKARDAMDKYMGSLSPDPWTDRLAGAQTADSDNQFMNSLIRAGIQAGSAISGSKADYSGVEALEKGTGRNVANFKEGLATRKEQQIFDKSASDINDEKKLKDPNSDISKETVAQLAKYGVNVKTAMEAKLLSPQIFNLIQADRHQDNRVVLADKEHSNNLLRSAASQKNQLELADKSHSNRMTIADKEQLNRLTIAELSQKNAKEIAQMKVATNKQKIENSLTKEKKADLFRIRDKLTSGEMGKMYANVNTAARSASILENFAKNPSAFGDYGTLLVGLKGLQGDDSVIRGEEMRLGMDATSFSKKLLNYVSQQKSGMKLQPEQRADMFNSIKVIREISADKYRMAAAPYLKQADELGIDHSLLLPEYLTSSTAKPSESQELTTSTNTRTFKSQQTPGSIVTVKSGKRYKMGADGLTGTEI